MRPIVKKCNCRGDYCNKSNKNFHVHVGNYCVHKNGYRHKY